MERGMRRVDLSGSGYEQVAGCCEYGKEASVSINAGNFLSRYGTISF
jgi:hypothetical protein